MNSRVMAGMYSARCTEYDQFDRINVTNNYSIDDTTVRQLMSQAYLARSWPKVVFQCLLATVGLFGNTVVFLAFVKKRKKNSANYYMIFLAMIDLFCCAVVIPLRITYTGIYFSFYSATGCKLLDWFMNASLAASAITLQATAMDRYQAVCHPFAWRKSKILKSPLIPILCVAFGFISTTPFLIMAGIEKYEINGQTLQDYGFPESVLENVPSNESSCFSLCEILNEYQGSWESQAYFFFTLLLFVALMSVTIVAYGAVYVNMRRHMEKFKNIPTNAVGNKVSPVPNVSYTIASGVSASEAGTSDGKHGLKGTQLHVPLPKVHKNLSTSDNESQLRSTLPKNIRENQFKVAKTLMIVTIVFVLAWVPFWVMTFLGIFNPSFDFYQTMEEHTLKVFFKDLLFINNALNPVVYFIYNQTFRSYCQRLCRKCACSKLRGRFQIR